ncbi:MAG: carnitine dehydratase [Rhizobacter sp.]|nr:carnitine dehydratase [Rhizobacter sp.]
MPIALIKTVPEALDDARESGRGMVLPLTGKHGEHIEVVGNPIRFTGEPQAASTYPPRLGADAEDVLHAWLGTPPGEVVALRDRGVIVQRQDSAA